jgi:hypothetical protein
MSPPDNLGKFPRPGNMAGEKSPQTAEFYSFPMNNSLYLYDNKMLAPNGTIVAQEVQWVQSKAMQKN